MKKPMQRGFTLIELVIVVLIIAVLAAIAITSYQGYVTRAARTKATQGLTNLAGMEERFFYSKNRYTKDPTELGIKDDPYCIEKCSDTRHYEISIPAANSTTYTLQAEPKDTQAKDTACGTLSLTKAGVKSASGDPSNQNRCWGS